MTRHLFLNLTCSVLLLCACTSPISHEKPTRLMAGDADALSQVTPTESLEIAQRYTSHEWRPFARNILHGPDKKGVVVNTPDLGFKDHLARAGWWLPGEVNRGIPYKWGGFDAPANFDTGTVPAQRQVMCHLLKSGNLIMPARVPRRQVWIARALSPAVSSCRACMIRHSCPAFAAISSRRICVREMC